MTAYNIDFDKYYNSHNLLLTPNQRLARKLLSEGCVYKQSKILKSFNIQSLNDFIAKLFDLIIETGLLSKAYFVLNNWQRELLFKKIIDNSSKTNNHNNDNNNIDISADSLYKKAIQAWSIAKQWGLDWHSWFDYLQPESRLFCNWAGLYNNYLLENNYLDPDEKLNIIIELLDVNNSLNNSLAFKKLLNITSIDLYGFDDYSVQFSNLITKLKQLSIKINILDLNLGVEEQKLCGNQNINIYTASNQQDEYYAVAAWAKQHYENNINKIGIIVPDLSNHREKLIKVFEEIIPDRQVWNISGGEPLANVPVIKVALIILELVLLGKVSLNDVRFLLKSNHYLKYGKNIVDYDQIKLNSQIDDLLCHLENYGYDEVSITDIVAKVGVFNKELADILICSYDSIQSQQLKLPSNWAYIYSQILLDIGWPAGLGAVANNSSEKYSAENISSVIYQAIACLQNCLQQISLLDNIYGSVTANQIYKDLKDLLNNTPFQIETDQNIIDILGMLEGAGINYDKLWLFSLTADVWPSTPDPNPFIPIDIQRKYHLPHATAERELEYAKKLTKRYLVSAQDITISYCKLSDDQENNLSPLVPLVPNFNNIHAVYKPDSLYLDKANISKLFNLFNLFDLFDLEYFIDSYGPKITKAHIKSGVKAIRLQALCPFRAFAETRLSAMRNYKLSIGPSVQLRGEIVHKALELFFTEFNTREKLQNLKQDADFYSKKLHQIIYYSINLFKTNYENIFTTGIVIIETELIYDLINQWLDLELLRDNFTVLALEKKYLLKLNNIQFNVRVDRIDQLETSEQEIIIIDYKTNKQNINSLYTEDLLEPQLPLYCFIEGLNKVAAVLYAQILEENPSYNGLGHKQININGCAYEADWELLVNKWKVKINQLANDYSGGLASVTPIYKEQTCSRCHLSGLCRKDDYA